MPHCPRCGDAGHADCGRGGPLDPPRFCVACGRRLEVQVLPDGYRARCLVCERPAAAPLRGRPGSASAAGS